MEAQKLVKYAGDICGKTESNFEANRRRKKEWNTGARRGRMFKKIQEKPEKFISNYRIMVDELGPVETERLIKMAIHNMFADPSRSKATLFEKDCSKRKSAELKGTLIIKFTIT